MVARSKLKFTATVEATGNTEGLKNTVRLLLKYRSDIKKQELKRQVSQ